MLLACTKKLADALKVNLIEVNPLRREPFFEWHAHLFIYKRRKGIIMMNNQTRYCIVLYGVMAEHLRDFRQISLSAIEKTWAAEGFSRDIIARYIEHCKDIVITKTYDRSILGQINDVIYLLPWQTGEWLHENEVVQIKASRDIGQMPMVNLPEILPIHSLRKELAKI